MNVFNVKFTHISVTSQTSKIRSSALLKRRRWSGSMRVVYWTGFLWQVRRKHHTSTERHTRCISCRRSLQLRWLSAGARNEASCGSNFTQHSLLFLTRNLVSSSDVSLRLKGYWICYSTAYLCSSCVRRRRRLSCFHINVNRTKQSNSETKCKGFLERLKFQKSSRVWSCIHSTIYHCLRSWFFFYRLRRFLNFQKSWLYLKMWQLPFTVCNLITSRSLVFLLHFNHLNTTMSDDRSRCTHVNTSIVRQA